MQPIIQPAQAATRAGVRLLRRAPQPTTPNLTLRNLSCLFAAAGLISLPAFAQVATLPSGGAIAAGNAAITQSGAAMRIDQSSAKAIIDWTSFNIGHDASVRFNQPSASSITLNRVGADGGRSIIDGSLTANGQVWLLNPGGALFGPSANINVGGLLASSLKIGNGDFMDGNYRFTRDGAGSIINQGTLTATDGRYIALLAPEVHNEGVIAARLGIVALASGDELRVDFSGDRLIEIAVDKATVNGLIENKNLVEAEGGWVLMSSDAADRLTSGAINNTGIVRATTLSEHAGVIKLLGGTIDVGGTLDASAANGGNGGFIETSGHTVNIDPSIYVTTAAPFGKTGNWLIDPNNYTIAATGGNITGTMLSGQLATTSVTIQTATMGTPTQFAPGNGDIFVNDPVSWSSGNTLELLAERNVTINSSINATHASSTLVVDAPSTFTISITGSVSVGDVGYHANDMSLIGTTTTSAASVGLRAYDSTRAIHIETSPTGGVLSLNPAEIATLHAPLANNIVIGWSGGGALAVTTSLDSSHVNAGDLHLNGSSVSIDAPITLASGTAGLVFETGAGGVALNAPVLVNNTVDFILSGGGIVTQLSTAPLTANQLVAEGSGSVEFDKSSVGNQISSVAANITGPIWVFNNSTPMTVASIDGVNGVTASRITLSTQGSMALNAPLVATDTSTIFYNNTWADPLCTPPCVHPHINLLAWGGFSNNVGANVFTLQPGKFWSLIADMPSTTNLNGLTPDAVSYDAASINGNILLSANRVFYSSRDPIPAPTLAPGPSAITTAETTVAQQSLPSSSAISATPLATAPAGGTGSGGATMSNFPLRSTESKPPPPLPRLILDASTTMPTLAGVLNRSDLLLISQKTHEARTQLFANALALLEKDPQAADIPDCDANSNKLLCIAKPLEEAQDGFVPVVRRKVALLIGNNAYHSPIPELETAINDVTAISAQLRDKMGYEVKVVENADRKEIVDALNDLILNTERNDSVLVMYSGHGYLKESTKTGYWIPTDASTNSPDNWISNSTIARALRNIPAKQVMLISDSCYSGSLTKEGKVTRTVRINRENTLTRRSVLAFSSGGEEPVADEGHDDHSIFAWNLIKSLNQMQGETSGEELHATIKDEVSREFPQVPQYGTVISAGHSEGGEYLLTPKKGGDL